MARVVYFYREMAEFIQIETDLLRERHEVTVVECATRWPQPLRVWRLVAGADLVMTWFASWHALMPALACRLLGRPFVVTVGGYDTARLPEIGYGHQRGGLRRQVARWVVRLASRVIAISEHTRAEVLAMGAPRERVVRLYLGLDPGRYQVPEQDRENLVVTLGGVHESNRLRKGIEPFVRTAALLPDVAFAVIGGWSDGTVDRLRAIATPNVRFIGWISHEEKLHWLARARVIVQASRHEAFGLAVAEAMLCGCVPVVSAAGALPEVVGEAGIVVASPEPGALADGIRAALALGAEGGNRARARALAAFTLDDKRRALVALERSLLSRHNTQGSSFTQAHDPRAGGAEP